MYKDKNWLKRQYIDLRKSSVEIAKKCSVSSTAILYWLEKFGIKRRTMSEALMGNEPSKETRDKMSKSHNKRTVFKIYMDKKWLRTQYIEKNLSAPEIANICGVIKSTIYFWLKKFDIPRRTNSEAQKEKYKQTNYVHSRLGKEVLKKTRTLISDGLIRWHKTHKHPLKDKEHSKKSKEKMSESAIKRCTSEWRENMSKIASNRTGSKNGNWQNGKSFESYPRIFNFDLKEKIRNRDNRVCQQCGKSELLNGGKRLFIHHKNGDKMDCRESNLISVCNVCNSKKDTIEKEFLLGSNLMWRIKNG